MKSLLYTWRHHVPPLFGRWCIASGLTLAAACFIGMLGEAAPVAASLRPATATEIDNVSPNLPFDCGPCATCYMGVQRLQVRPTPAVMEAKCTSR